MSVIRYRPEIDGLRAVAVIAVILFHFGVDRMKGGFVGVDVFFVISGFLITSILKREFDRNEFSFRKFWERRVRRIVPALVLVLFVTQLVFAVYGFRPERRTVGMQGAAALFSLANVWLWKTAGSYWGPQADQALFLHTWSLSVEEQFYLLFPIVLWCVYRLNAGWLPPVLLGVSLVSLVLFLYGSVFHPSAAFYLLPTRAWELAVGGLLAVVHSPEKNSVVEMALAPWAACAGLGLIAMACVITSESGMLVMAAVAGSALVIRCGQVGICHRVLASGLLTAVGRLSYSLYLWHWPVLLMSDMVDPDAPSAGFPAVVCLLVLSLISYHCVEQPFRRPGRPFLLIGGGWIAALTASIALIVLPDSYDTSLYRQSPYSRYECHPHMGSRADADRAAAWRRGGYQIDGRTEVPRMVVFGDSHGVMWADTIASIAKKNRITTSIFCVSVVNPGIRLPLRRRSVPAGWDFSSEEKFEYDRRRLEMVRKWKPDLVILGVRWAAWKANEFLDLLDWLQQQHVRVLLLEQPPELGFGNRSAVQYLCFRGILPEPGRRTYLKISDPAPYLRAGCTVRYLADQFDNCRIIPSGRLYLNGDRTGALVLNGRDVVYRDDDHLLTGGTKIAEAQIARSILRELNRERVDP